MQTHDHGSSLPEVIIAWCITAISWALSAEGHHALGSIAAVAAIVYSSMKIYDRLKRRFR